MKIIHLKKHEIPNDIVAVIGFFDGLHKAHQSLINETISLARDEKKQSALITFSEHPKSVLFELDFNYITPLEKKLELLKAYKLDYILIIDFNKDTSALSAEQFISDYLSGINTLVCGFDFKFGYRAMGSVDYLKKNAPFNVKIIDEIKETGFKIGSTHIRDLIKSGAVEKVVPLLTRHYSLSGIVVHGQKKGRLIGYPTANLKIEDFIIPKKGVYATYTEVDQTIYESMTSIGFNPTLNLQHQLSVETHILNFNGDIYGKTITVYFINRLRDEQKFEHVQALIKAIDLDQVHTKDILNKKPLIK
jgi:riboflavin kinase/FMN adenylyltransferase